MSFLNNIGNLIGGIFGGGIGGALGGGGANQTIQDSQTIMQMQQRQARAQMWASAMQASSNSTLEHAKDMMNQTTEVSRSIRNSDRKLATEAVADQANLIKDTSQQLGSAASA